MISLILLGIAGCGSTHRRGPGPPQPTAASTDLAPCRAIRVRTAGTQSYTLHQVTIYALANSSTRSCSLHGYPDVSAYRGSVRIPLSIHHEHRPPWGAPARAVTLRPDAQAGLIIGHLTNPNGPPCEQLARLRITLIGAARLRPAPQSDIDVCAHDAVSRAVYESPVLPHPGLP